MNSPEPRYSDELDDLIKETLNTRLNRYVPPDRVWRRVETGVQQKTPPAHRCQPSFRLSTIAQLAFLLLALLVGGVDIQSVTLFQADSGLSPLLLPQYQVVTPVPVETGKLPAPASAGDVFSLSPDRMEIQTLKSITYQIRRERNQLRAETNNTPPLFLPPTDVFPHSDSAAGRVLYASAPQPVAFLEALFFPQRGEPGWGVIQ